VVAYRKTNITMNSPSAASGSNTIMAARAFSIASMVVQRVITDSTLGICAVVAFAKKALEFLPGREFGIEAKTAR
jgi:hypothetical protein